MAALWQWRNSRIEQHESSSDKAENRRIYVAEDHVRSADAYRKLVERFPILFLRKRDVLLKLVYANYRASSGRSPGGTSSTAG